MTLMSIKSTESLHDSTPVIPAPLLDVDDLMDANLRAEINSLDSATAALYDRALVNSVNRHPSARVRRLGAPVVSAEATVQQPALAAAGKRLGHLTLVHAM